MFQRGIVASSSRTLERRILGASRAAVSAPASSACTISTSNAVRRPAALALQQQIREQQRRSHHVMAGLPFTAPAQQHQQPPPSSSLAPRRASFSTEPALQNSASPPAPEAAIPKPAEDKGEGEAPAASEKVQKLGEEILGLNMLELGQLLKVLKHRLGLTDADLRGVAVAMPGAGGAAAGGEAAAEEAPAAAKDSFDLKLVSFDEKSKIKVIKEVRTISGLGLKEAKELVEGVPKIVKKEVKKEEAEKLLAKLQEVGAKVELV